MSYCRKCGTQLADNDNFCPNCGEPSENNTNTFEKTFNNFNNTADDTASYEKTDIDNNKVMAVLSYLGILFLIPLLAAKNSKYAQFHCNQGLVLFIFSAAASVLISIFKALHILIIFWPIILVLSLVNILFFVLMIIGIVNAAQGKAKELPIIGKVRILK